MLKPLRLKKNEERRLLAGHVWIFSNEIDTHATPLKNFSAGEEVAVYAHNNTPLGVAFVNPHSLIAARLFTRNPEERLDLPFFITKIKTALDLRTTLYPKPFYRLVFGEGDGLPGLVIDRFHETLVIQLNAAGMDVKTDIIIEALLAVLPETTSILLRNDTSTRKQEGLDSFVKAGFGTPPEKIFLEENQTPFYAPLWTGQKTGWFYDHRLNRSRLAQYAPNRRVLDVFSYLGAWGIQALQYGATSVTTIDASLPAAKWIKENAALNHVEDKVTIITEDAFLALKALIKAKETFDLIILDPPAFVKKFKDKKEGLLAYQRINEMALRLLDPEGILITCSCSMHMTHDDLVQSLRRASVNSGVALHLLERGHQAPDHPVHLAIPETDYLKMLIARRLN